MIYLIYFLGTIISLGFTNGVVSDVPSSYTTSTGSISLGVEESTDN